MRPILPRENSSERNWRPNNDLRHASRSTSGPPRPTMAAPAFHGNQHILATRRKVGKERKGEQGREMGVVSTAFKTILLGDLCSFASCTMFSNR